MQQDSKFESNANALRDLITKKFQQDGKDAYVQACITSYVQSDILITNVKQITGAAAQGVCDFVRFATNQVLTITQLNEAMRTGGTVQPISVPQKDNVSIRIRVPTTSNAETCADQDSDNEEEQKTSVIVEGESSTSASSSIITDIVTMPTSSTLIRSSELVTAHERCEKCGR